MWQIKRLALIHLGFLLILGSWATPLFSDGWHALDKASFFFFNGLLDSSQAWQRFWAYTNVRSFDVVPAILMLSLFFTFLLADRRQASKRMGQMLLIGLFSVLLLTFSKKALDFERYSPSLSLEPVYRITQLAPDIDTKDASRGSFPGEHTMTLSVWVFLFWHFARWRFGLAALSLALIFSIPRLVSGAHWLTDDLIGGIGIAAVASSWIMFTPFGAYCLDKLSPLSHKLCLLLRIQSAHQQMPK